VITSTVYGIKTVVYGSQAGIVAITVIMLNRGHDNLDALLSDWLKSGRRSSPNTAESYRRNIRDFMRFCGKAPADVTVADVVSYQAHLRQNYKASSESQKLASIRSFFRFLKAGKVITENPAELIEGPRAEPKFKERSLSEDQVLAMIEAARPSPYDALFIRLLYVTAGRVSEVLALTWARFMPADDSGCRVRITGKGKRNREVYIPGALWADLERLRDGAEPSASLFTINRHQAWEIVKKLARAAGVDGAVSPHWFRHAHASHAIERGATLGEVRDQLGHADIKTTSLYIHSSAETSTTRLLKIV
jgi:integrase/recombinase XerD